MATLTLAGSVGGGSSKGGAPHNQADDVAKVRDRFIELGYTWVSEVKTGKEDEFIRLIKLFKSITKGEAKLDKGSDGRIDKYGELHKWLAAENAPGWVKMEGNYGRGWQSTPNLAYTKDNRQNSHTTTWMEERIRWAGWEYANNALFSGMWEASPLWIRDCSPAKGGDAWGHKSHETGLDVDMRLPIKPPDSHLWIKLDAGNYTEKFHYEAAVLQLEAIKAMMDAKYVFFNDPRCIKKGLCSNEPNHGNHYHIRIKPPVRIDGNYM